MIEGLILFYVKCSFSLTLSLFFPLFLSQPNTEIKAENKNQKKNSKSIALCTIEIMFIYLVLIYHPPTKKKRLLNSCLT